MLAVDLDVSMGSDDVFRWVRVTRWAAAATMPWLSLAARIAFAQQGHRLGSGIDELRESYRRLRKDGGAVLVCPNHLTLADPFLVGWALGWFRLDPVEWLRRPWVVAADTNLARLFPGPLRVLAWLFKCRGIPRARGTDRSGRVLRRLARLMEEGDAILVFPEGRRSPDGWVQVGARTYGVGRLMASVSGCRVLVVYMRGTSQASGGARPDSGQVFHVRHEVIEPEPGRGGLRRTLRLNQQILGTLGELEARYFDEIPEAVRPPRPAAVEEVAEPRSA